MAVLWYYGYMSKKRYASMLGTFFVALLLSLNAAIANGDRALILIPNELNQPLDIEPFVAHKGHSTPPMVHVQRPDRHLSDDKEFKFTPPKKDNNLEERIMAMIPYSEEMKYLWNIADGDIDLYFKGLRGDRRNKGVEYTTHKLPLIGQFEDTEFKAEVGEDMEFSFYTSSLPFKSKIEGFNFKGSVGDDARISARYTVKFD